MFENNELTRRYTQPGADDDDELTPIHDRYDVAGFDRELNSVRQIVAFP